MSSEKTDLAYLTIMLNLKGLILFYENLIRIFKLILVELATVGEVILVNRYCVLLGKLLKNYIAI